MGFTEALGANHFQPFRCPSLLNRFGKGIALALFVSGRNLSDHARDGSHPAAHIAIAQQVNFVGEHKSVWLFKVFRHSPFIGPHSPRRGVSHLGIRGW